MLVKLTHPFLWRCENPDVLLKNCNKLNTFLGRVEKQCVKLYPDAIDESETDKKARIDQINSFKGESFELLIEALIRLFPCDLRIGPIKNYEVVTSGDHGVDGHGTFPNGKPATVQCKYRQHDHVLTANADHLSNFVTCSLLEFGVDQQPDENGKCNMIIFTSADSLNFYTDKQMFQGRVHARCRNDLRQMLDGNNLFWEYFQKSWHKSLKELKV